MTHIIRDPDRCTTDWCSHKEELLKQQEITKSLVEQVEAQHQQMYADRKQALVWRDQVVLLREVLDTWGTHTSDEECPVCEALEATK